MGGHPLTGTAWHEVDSPSSRWAWPSSCLAREKHSARSTNHASCPMCRADSSTLSFERKMPWSRLTRLMAFIGIPSSRLSQGGSPEAHHDVHVLLSAFHQAFSNEGTRPHHDHSSRPP